MDQSANTNAFAPTQSGATTERRRALQVMALFDGAIVALDHRELERPGTARRDGGQASVRFERYTIGPDAAADFAAPLDGDASIFALVTRSSLGLEVGVPAGARVEIASGKLTLPLAEWLGPGRTRSDEDGVLYVALANDTEVCIDIGKLTFRVRLVELGRALPRPLRPDWRAHRYTAGSFVVSALACLLAMAVPPDLKSLSIDAFAAEHHFARLELMPPVVPPTPLATRDEKTPAAVAAAGKRAKGASGKAGRMTARDTMRKMAIKGPRDNPDPHLARQAATELARNFGILGELHSGRNASVSLLLSTRDSALGRAAEDAMGGLLGTQVGDTSGVGGLDVLGRGPGGGGGGLDTVGLNRIGTIGDGFHGGPGGPGGPVGRLRDKKPHTIDDGKPPVINIVGSLDKEIIRRVIRRHLAEVRFCYEQELGRHPDLYGRIGVQFTIGATGQVVSSVMQHSTLGSPTVEGCVTQAVRRWEFPRPQGGIVVVSYPFVLQRAGE